MAEPDEGAFEILGKILVDLDATKKSFKDVETEVEKFVKNYNAHLDKLGKGTSQASALPGGGHGGGMGEGPGGPGGGDGPGAHHNPAAIFAHTARVLRHDLGPALAQLSPMLSGLLSTLSTSARSAVFFGAAVGGIAIAGALASEVIAKYIEKAKEMHEATVGASEAMRTWDFARAEAGIKKVNEAIGDYVVSVKTMQEGPGGKAGFWGWLVATTNVAVEKITGGLDTAVEKYKIAANAAAQIGKEFELPKSVLELDKARSEILLQEAESTKKLALTNEQLAKSYETIKGAQQAALDVDIAKLRLEDEKAQKEIDPEELKKELQKRLDLQKTALKEAQEQAGKTDVTSATGMSSATSGRLKAATDAVAETEKKIQNVQSVAAELREQIAEKTELKITALREKTAAKLRASYHDEAMAFLQSREAMAAQANQAILESENKLEEVRRKQASTAESADKFEDRLTKTRENALGPIQAAIEMEEKMYEERSKEAREKQAAANLMTDADPKAAADMHKQATMDIEAIDKAHAASSADLNQKLNVEKAKQDAQYATQAQARLHEIVAEEDRIFQHRVKMGQQTMQAEIENQQDAARDPRRTQGEREQAEERALQMRKEYAEQYFKFYQNLGVKTFQQELAVHTGFLSKTVEGSKEWFNEVDKIANVYKKMHDDAKGIVSAVGAAAEAEAKRQGKKINNAQDFAKFATMAEQRDAETLQGGGKKGEFLGALGRQDMWRQQQQFGGAGVAIDKAFMNPQQELANTIANTATRPDIHGNVKQEMSSQVIKNAEENIRGLADAAQIAADRLRNIGSQDWNDLSNVRSPAPDAVRDIGSGGKADRLSTVLQSAGGKLFTNVDPVTDSAMGRTLGLAGKRGANP